MKMAEKKPENIVEAQPSDEKKRNASETAVILKKSFANAWKSHKKLFSAVIAIAVVIVLLFAGAGIIGTDAVRVRLVSSFIPDSLYNEQVDLTFYSEMNPDFDSEVDGEDYFAMYKCYYYPGNDTSGTKVYVNDSGMFYLDDMKVDVSTSFIFAGLQRVAKIVDTLRYIAIALIFVIIAVLIYVWYRADKKRQQAGKSKTRAHR